MVSREALIAELKRIASGEARKDENLAVAYVLEAPREDIDRVSGGDPLKRWSYEEFRRNNPMWEPIRDEAIRLGKDPTEEYLNYIFRDHTCKACGKKGHSHHPACKCRRCS